MFTLPSGRKGDLSWCCCCSRLLHWQQNQCFQAFTMEQGPAALPESSWLQPGWNYWDIPPCGQNYGSYPSILPPVSSGVYSGAAQTVEVQPQGSRTRFSEVQRWLGYLYLKLPKETLMECSQPPGSVLQNRSWQKQVASELSFARPSWWRWNYWCLVLFIQKLLYFVQLFSGVYCVVIIVSHTSDMLENKTEKFKTQELKLFVCT